MLHYWDDFTTVSLPEFPLFAQYLQTAFKVCEQLSLPLHPAKRAAPINCTFEHLWTGTFSLPNCLSSCSKLVVPPMFATVHWQQGAKSLVHEGGSVALTCSPLGQGIAGTLTSAVSKWLVVLQPMFQVGGFPLAFVRSAWLWFGGFPLPCPQYLLSPRTLKRLRVSYGWFPLTVSQWKLPAVPHNCMGALPTFLGTISQAWWWV